MTSQAASPSAPFGDKSRPTGFLDLPLEIRIMVYERVVVSPDNDYIVDENHPRGLLPAILLTHSTITRNIYQLYTFTAVIRHERQTFSPYPHFWRMQHDQNFQKLTLRNVKKLIKYHGQPDHKELVVKVRIRCKALWCSEALACVSCRYFAYEAYIIPMDGIGLDKRLISVI